MSRAAAASGRTSRSACGVSDMRKPVWQRAGASRLMVKTSDGACPLFFTMRPTAALGSSTLNAVLPRARCSPWMMVMPAAAILPTAPSTAAASALYFAW